MSDSGGTERVCVVGSGWYFLSGISYYTCRIANALADRHVVSAILMRRLIPRRLYPGRERVGADLTALRYRDDVECFDGLDYYWMPSMLQAVRFLVRQRPNIVLFEWWTGSVVHSYFVLALVARVLGARNYVEFHEAFDTGEAGYPLVGLYVRLLRRPVLALMDGAVVHSESDRAHVAGSFGFHGKAVVVVPHGPYDHLVSPESLDTQAETDVVDLLFFGTIRPYKGLEHLVQAFDSLPPDLASSFHLTVVGETWENWSLPSALIAGSRYRERIEFVNRYVSDDEVAYYFSRASAVVLPYLRSSASGPLHMAMSYGLPVAVSDVGGLREAAGQYAGTRFVRPGDVSDLCQALLDLATMTGRRYQDPFSWSRSVVILEHLFAGASEASG